MDKHEAAKIISSSKVALKRYKQKQWLHHGDVLALKQCREAVKFFGGSLKRHGINETQLQDMLDLESYLQKTYGSSLYEAQKKQRR